MSFSAFRLSVAKSLGFETFVEESIHDYMEQYAFLIPEDVDRETAKQIRDFLQVCFSNNGYRVERADLFEEGTYEYNWCGSRHLTVHLERHWLFELAACERTTLPLPPKPSCDPWVVANVDYDSMRPAGSRIRYHTSYMTAATPATYMMTHERIRNSVHDYVNLHAQTDCKA